MCVVQGGANSRKWLPNARHADNPTALSQLEFLGMMVGAAIRQRNPQPFEFAPLVWRALVGTATDASSGRRDEVSAELAGFDETLAARVAALRRAAKASTAEAAAGGAGGPGDAPASPAALVAGAAAADASGGDDSPDELQLEDCFFTIRTMDGREEELLPGGRAVPVTLASVGTYADLLEQFRLHECDAGIAALRRGLARVVPARLLRLISWQELESMVRSPAPGIRAR